MLKEIQEEINRINLRIEELEKQLELLKERRKILIDKLSKVTPPCVVDNCGFEATFYNYIKE